MNNENCWGNNGYATNTENITGNISCLCGDFSSITGCGSKILADAKYINSITNNLDDIQLLMKKHRIKYISFCCINFSTIRVWANNELIDFKSDECSLKSLDERLLMRSFREMKNE